MGIEAGRESSAVRLIAPRFGKAYLNGQKNDAQDTAAICEAVSRPEMQFVRRNIERQDLQALHPIRRLIGSRQSDSGGCWPAGAILLEFRGGHFILGDPPAAVREAILSS